MAFVGPIPCKECGLPITNYRSLKIRYCRICADKVKRKQASNSYIKKKNGTS